jgi:hypothetical protein
VNPATTNGHFWPPSYLAASCANAPPPTISQYIDQQQHPARRPGQDPPAPNDEAYAPNPVRIIAVPTDGSAAVQVRETSSRLPEYGDSLRGHGFEGLIHTSSLVDPAAEASPHARWHAEPTTASP